MTTKEQLISQLEQRGLFKAQAQQIMEFAIPKLDEYLQDAAPEYQVTWNRPASEYPKPLLDALFMFTKPYVVEWARQNIPLAWWIPMFE